MSGLTALSKDSAGEVIFLSLDIVQFGERVLLEAMCKENFKNSSDLLWDSLKLAAQLEFT